MTSILDTTAPHGRWAADRAGHHLTRKVPVAHPEETATRVRASLEKSIHAYRSVDYVYVAERDGCFVGVLSIKELYAIRGNAKVGDACKRGSLVTVRPDSRAERAAYLAVRRNIKAVPVVAEGKLLGVILNDTILGILYRETHEDLLRLAGIHRSAAGPSADSHALLSSFRHRAPWLLIGLVGGLITAIVIGSFEETLQDNLLLASFIPLIVYMASAVGTQMQVCYIRDSAMDRGLEFGAYFVRQVAVTVLLAACFSLLLGMVVTRLHGDGRVGLILCVSMAIAICSSLFTGLVVPFAFGRMRVDPAAASGPIATIPQDFLTIVIYLSVATVLL